MRKLAILTGIFCLCAASAMAQDIQGVRPDLGHPWQVGVDYTFVRFNEVPSVTTNSSGFNASAVRYTGDWLAADVELSDALASQSGQTSQLLFTGAGGRIRLPFARSLQPWAHALVGYSHLSPKTSFGSGSSLGYKAGGGVDLNPFHSRITYRVSVDMLGTEFFSTHQVSPEISFGVVLTLGH